MHRADVSDRVHVALPKKPQIQLAIGMDLCIRDVRMGGERQKRLHSILDLFTGKEEVNYVKVEPDSRMVYRLEEPHDALRAIHRRVAVGLAGQDELLALGQGRIVAQ